MLTTSTTVFACLSKACAPPPVGRGGSTAGRSTTINLGSVKVSYAPDHPDGGPDPGEVVWADIPFEEDRFQRKDRPVLIIGRIGNGSTYAAVQLTSKRGNPDSLNIGSGSWDRQQRPSAIRLDRIVTVHPGNFRREGAAMPRRQFERVVKALEMVQGIKHRG